MLNTVVEHKEKHPAFPHNYCPTKLRYYNNLPFHTGLIGGHNAAQVSLGVSHCSNSVSDAYISAGKLPGWKMSVSQQWQTWTKHLLHQHSAQYHGSMQEQKSFTGQISSSRFKVIKTALLMEQISQNCQKKKTKITRLIPKLV